MQSEPVRRLTRDGDGCAVPDFRQDASMLAGVGPRLTSLCRNRSDFNRVHGGAYLKAYVPQIWA
jgi:hypothetical protein